MPSNNKSIAQSNKSTDLATPALNKLREADFMGKLDLFMKDRNTPINRLPHIGYRQCKYSKNFCFMSIYLAELSYGNLHYSFFIIVT